MAATSLGSFQLKVETGNPFTMHVSEGREPDEEVYDLKIVYDGNQHTVNTTWQYVVFQIHQNATYLRIKGGMPQ